MAHAPLKPKFTNVTNCNRLPHQARAALDPLTIAVKHLKYPTQEYVYQVNPITDLLNIQISTKALKK